MSVRYHNNTLFCDSHAIDISYCLQQPSKLSNKQSLKSPPSIQLCTFTKTAEAECTDPKLLLQPKVKNTEEDPARSRQQLGLVALKAGPWSLTGGPNLNIQFRTSNFTLQPLNWYNFVWTLLAVDIYQVQLRSVSGGSLDCGISEVCTSRWHSSSISSSFDSSRTTTTDEFV